MNSFKQAKHFIFTGTPGSGKTSVIKELEKSDYAVIYEAATDVISAWIKTAVFGSNQKFTKEYF